MRGPIAVNNDLTTLCGAAAAVGFLHTVLGPDHYLPFAAIAKSRSWSLRRTIGVTLLCGLGHVLASITIGLIGIAMGTTIFGMEWFESVRGEIAGWSLLVLGAIYFAWGLRRAFRQKRHAHLHVHADGTVHRHAHDHTEDHLHVHDSVGMKSSSTRGALAFAPWLTFVVLIFGPCEPLIPFLMYPAAIGDPTGAVLIAAVFGLTTLVTMTLAVAAIHVGLGELPTAGVERYGHALAGLVILACGVAVKAGL